MLRAVELSLKIGIRLYVVAPCQDVGMCWYCMRVVAAVHWTWLESEAIEC